MVLLWEVFKLSIKIKSWSKMVNCTYMEAIFLSKKGLEDIAERPERTMV